MKHHEVHMEEATPDSDAVRGGFNCTGLAPPEGGSFGTCSADGKMIHADPCDRKCSDRLQLLPTRCWNGTISAPSGWCGPGMEWDGEEGSTCTDCQAGVFDGDSSSLTEEEAEAAEEKSRRADAQTSRRAPDEQTSASQVGLKKKCDNNDETPSCHHPHPLWSPDHQLAHRCQSNGAAPGAPRGCICGISEVVTTKAFILTRRHLESPRPGT